MAKIIITVEDKDGGVQVICTPSVENMLKTFHNTIAGGTMAEGYAVAVLNGLRELDKRMAKQAGADSTIIIPKVGN